MKHLIFKASFDTTSVIITIAVFILFSFLGYNNVKSILNSKSGMFPWYNLGMLAFIIVFFLAMYLFSIKNYEITEDKFLINRPIGKISINLADIKAYKIYDPSIAVESMRSFGNGGIFGYYGKFYNPNIGSMTYYTTQKKNRILIMTFQGDKIVISPDDSTIVDHFHKIK